MFSKSGFWRESDFELWGCCGVSVWNGGAGSAGCWGRVLEEAVEVAGDVPFEAASGFSGGFSLADAFGYVGPGFGAVPSAGDSDGVDGAVELAVAVAAEPVAGLLPPKTLGGVRRRPGERRRLRCGIGLGVTRRCIHLRGGDRPDPVLLEQLGSCGCDQFGDGRFQFGYLIVARVADASGYRTHGLFGGGEFVDGGGWDSKRRAFGDKSSGVQTSELVPKINRRGHYQGF